MEINLVTKSIRFITKYTIILILLTIYTSKFYKHVYSVNKYNIKLYAYYFTHYKTYNYNKRIYKKSLPRALYKLNINNTQKDCN